MTLPLDVACKLHWYERMISIYIHYYQFQHKCNRAKKIQEKRTNKIVHSYLNLKKIEAKKRLKINYSN